MPANRNALLRYRTIDKCLSNHYRRWTLDDLIEACADALYEYEGIRKGISRRTIQLDIQMMRSDRLGYNAPIIVVDNKYYKYEDPDYSILSSPLSENDVEQLGHAIDILKQMVGFPAMSAVADIVSRLDDQLRVTSNESGRLIFMENNDRLVGLSLVPEIYDALRRQKTLKITYQSFKAKRSSSFVFHPILLKEYRNRWFVLGQRKGQTELLTLALDRIQALSIWHEPCNPLPTHFDPEKYYREMVGVTRNLDDQAAQIRFWASADQSPYLKTKPIHHTQMVVEQYEDGSTLFQIETIVNYELEREILGYGDGLRVMTPKSLADRIANIHKKALLCYQSKVTPFQPI